MPRLKNLGGAGGQLWVTDKSAFWLRRWVLLAQAGWLLAGPLSVSAGDTIQSAVDEAPAGTILNIPGGVFEGTVFICKDLTLQGAGMTNTILDGGATGPVVRVCPKATVTIRDLTIRNGQDFFTAGISNAGDLTLCSVLVTNNRQVDEFSAGRKAGGLYNTGTMVIQDCIFARNNSDEGSAGGIYNSGTVQMIRSMVVNNGGFASVGGIYNDGLMCLTECTLDQNSGHGIGGIRNLGSMEIQRSTLSGNNSDAIGGIFNLAGGTMGLTNCTLFGNSGVAEAGAIANVGYLIVESCTVTGNGTGAQDAAVNNLAEGRCDLRNCIVAGNVGTGSDLRGTFNSLGYNLLGINYLGLNIFTLSGDTNGNIIGVDPLLGPLQNNGGPTMTCALLPGSPAIDAGSPELFMPTDQRGVTRSADGDGDGFARADIGAFEKAGPRILEVRILPEGTLQLRCLGVAGMPYNIEVATNLLAPVWVYYASFQADSDGRYDFTDLEWKNVTRRFYRAVEE